MQATARTRSLRHLLADRRTLRWLIGATAAWLLLDFAYYGNTIASPTIVSLVAPHATLIETTGITLAIFAVFALPGYLIAAFTVDTLGRRRVQAVGSSSWRQSSQGCGSSPVRPPLSYRSSCCSE